MERKVIERSSLPKDYRQMMLMESHHDHKIVEINGILRWEENEVVNELTNPNIVSLNDLIPIIYECGQGRNSEFYRSLYRNIGYSLNGYHEVFYWDMNNEEVGDYAQPIKLLRTLELLISKIKRKLL